MKCAIKGCQEEAVGDNRGKHKYYGAIVDYCENHEKPVRVLNNLFGLAHRPQTVNWSELEEDLKPEVYEHIEAVFGEQEIEIEEESKQQG